MRVVDGDPVLSGSVALLLRESGVRVQLFETVSAFLARRGDDASDCGAGEIRHRAERHLAHDVCPVAVY